MALLSKTKGKREKAGGGGVSPSLSPSLPPWPAARRPTGSGRGEEVARATRLGRLSGSGAPGSTQRAPHARPSLPPPGAAMEAAAASRMPAHPLPAALLDAASTGARCGGGRGGGGGLKRRRLALATTWPRPEGRTRLPSTVWDGERGAGGAGGRGVGRAARETPKCGATPRPGAAGALPPARGPRRPHTHPAPSPQTLPPARGRHARRRACARPARGAGDAGRGLEDGQSVCRGKS